MVAWLIVLPIVALGIGFTLGRLTFHRHKWTPWVFYQNVDIYVAAHDDVPVERKKVYTRMCKKCHLPQTTRIKA